jgi:hypothetical protein
MFRSTCRAPPLAGRCCWTPESGTRIRPPVSPARPLRGVKYICMQRSGPIWRFSAGFAVAGARNTRKPAPGGQKPASRAPDECQRSETNANERKRSQTNANERKRSQTKRNERKRSETTRAGDGDRQGYDRHHPPGGAAALWLPYIGQVSLRRINRESLRRMSPACHLTLRESRVIAAFRQPAGLSLAPDRPAVIIGNRPFSAF